MVARLSMLFLYPNDTNGEVGFAQFPMVQKSGASSLIVAYLYKNGNADFAQFPIV